MKKLIACIAIIGIVFSSCNGKYTIAKRKYNKGFYVSKSGNSTTKPAVAGTKIHKELANKEVIETVVVAKAEEKAVIAPIIVESFKAEVPVKNYVAKHENPAVASISKTNYTPAQEIKPIAIKKTESAKKGDSDANLILMIILCFFPFINLIAIYLHDSGVTTNFWVTLLLDFLFFLPGIIFALLVVLDVVDLG